MAGLKLQLGGSFGVGSADAVLPASSGVVSNGSEPSRYIYGTLPETQGGGGFLSDFFRHPLHPANIMVYTSIASLTLLILLWHSLPKGGK
jgi:hypothetical protein